MFSLNHKFMLELSTTDGADLGRVPAVIDWLPAVEHAHFSAIVAGAVPAVTSPPACDIEPIWDQTRRRPYVAGARVVVDPDGARHGAEIPPEYFVAAAESASAALVRRGALKEGDPFRYRMAAYAVEPHAANGAAEAGVSVEEIAQPLGITDHPLRPALDRGLLVGDNDPDDMPVILPHRVLEDARALARRAGDHETGGFLLGRLRRDDGCVYLDLCAQVPALHAREDATRLTFTPETWAAGREALALRGTDEAFVGWWHFHPDWCRNCDPSRRKVCPLNRVFFSRQDCELHRTVFPRAYQVALLLSHRDGAFTPALFGWRRGVIKQRAFHLLDPPAAGDGDPVVTATPAVVTATPAVVTATIGGSERAPHA